MKRATLIATAIACYWIVRVVSAPVPTVQELPTTIDELQVSGVLEDQAPLTDVE